MAARGEATQKGRRNVMPALAILAFYVVIGWGLLWGFFEAFDYVSKRDKGERVSEDTQASQDRAV